MGGGQQSVGLAPAGKSVGPHVSSGGVTIGLADAKGFGLRVEAP